MNFDFEVEIIKGIIEDPSKAKLVARSGINHSHFDNELHAYIYKTIAHFTDNDLEVNEYTLLDKVANDPKLDTTKKVFHQQKIRTLLKEKPTEAFNYSLSKLREIRDEQEIKKYVNSVSQAYLKDNDLKKFAEKLSKARDIISPDSDYEIREYTTEEDYNRRHIERREIATGVSTTLDFSESLVEFQRAFPKGIQSKTITGIGGQTGVGKSILVGNIINTAISPRNKLNVLYVIAENRYIEATTRLDAIVQDREYELFYVNAEEDPKGLDFFKNLTPEGYGNLFCVKVTIGKFSTQTIKGFIDDILDKYNIPIQMVAVDSPDHMRADQATFAKNDMKGKIYEELKALTDEYDLITITSIPLVKDAGSNKKKEMTSEDVAGSYEIARLIDNLFFFSKSNEDLEIGRRQITFVKGRDAKSVGYKLVFKITPSLRFIKWEEVNAIQDEASGLVLELKRSEDAKKLMPTKNLFMENIKTRSYTLDKEKKFNGKQSDES